MESSSGPYSSRYPIISPSSLQSLTHRGECSLLLPIWPAYAFDAPACPFDTLRRSYLAYKLTLLSAHTNSGTVLDRILESRRSEVEHRKCVLPETALKYGAKAASPVRDFYSALSREGLNIIAELKPASPSRGVIREPFDAPELAKSLVTSWRRGAFCPYRRRIFSWLAEKPSRCAESHGPAGAAEGFYL